MDCNLYTLYIKQYREMRRMTQSELADMIGKSQSYVAQIEKDNSIRNKSILLSDLILKSHALDVCPNDLYRFRCIDCHRFYSCNRHQYSEDDDIYFKEHFEYYI
jgi:DNA-binding XRE family transcriptional regulator